MEESVLCANEDAYVQALVANPTDSPKELACGAVIGQAEPFVEASPRDMIDGTVETVNEAKYREDSVSNVDTDLGS